MRKLTKRTMYAVSGNGKGIIGGSTTGGTTDGRVEDGGFSENSANARLISAAPDLLAAIMNSDNAHWTPAMRAAMSKALGEAP